MADNYDSIPAERGYEGVPREEQPPERPYVLVDADAASWMGRAAVWAMGQHADARVRKSAVLVVPHVLRLRERGRVTAEGRPFVKAAQGTISKASGISKTAVANALNLLSNDAGNGSPLSVVGEGASRAPRAYQLNDASMFDGVDTKGEDVSRSTNSAFVAFTTQGDSSPRSNVSRSTNPGVDGLGCGPLTQGDSSPRSDVSRSTNGGGDNGRLLISIRNTPSPPPLSPCKSTEPVGPSQDEEADSWDGYIPSIEGEGAICRY